MGRTGIIAASLTLSLAACEKPFEPIQQSDFAFSIYGLLDASMDTQWVRVTPLRTELLTAPGLVDAIVTLEEIETGAMEVMKDSLVTFHSPFFGTEVFTHNFWGTMPMIPGRHYRLTATRPDGAASSATVLIPVVEDPVMELWTRYYLHSFPQWQHVTRPAQANIRGTRHIGLLLGVPCEGTYRHRQEFLRIVHYGRGDEGDPHRGRLEWADGPWADDLASPTELRPPWATAGPPPCKRIAVIASGAEWPFREFQAFREAAHPNAVDTVERGVGFVAGVQSYHFPFEICTPITRDSDCTVTFSGRSAILEGYVASSCDHGALSGVQVTLRGPASGGFRHAVTSVEGRFRFRGVDPGAPYTVSLSRRDYEDYASEPRTLAESATDTLAAVMTIVDEDSCPPQADSGAGRFAAAAPGSPGDQDRSLVRRRTSPWLP